MTTLDILDEYDRAIQRTIEAGKRAAEAGYVHWLSRHLLDPRCPGLHTQAGCSLHPNPVKH